MHRHRLRTATLALGLALSVAPWTWAQATATPGGPAAVPPVAAGMGGSSAASAVADAARSPAAALAFDTVAASGSPDVAAALDAPDAPGAAGAADSMASPASAAPDRVAEVRATFGPESRAYARTRQILAFVDPLVALLAGLLILFSGISAALRDVAHRASPRRYLRVLVFLALYSGVAFVLVLPLEWYRGFALEHRYGLSTQTLGGWFGDQIKGLGSSIALFGVVPLVALAYHAIERSPRRWWLWLAAGTAPIVLAGALLQPLVFEPLFNRFTALRDPVLRARVLELAGRAGIPARRVLEMDASAQTRKLNAYVSGFGASQRIVIYDTMLEGMTPDEILFVVGHEAGHYRLGHIWQGIVVTAAGSAAFFLLVFGLTRWAARRFGPRWGFRELHDIASLPLLALVLSVVVFAARPASNAWSRHIEREADAFGLELTRDSDAGARAFIRLAAGNRADPEPCRWVKWMLYTHPPLVERVRFALDYRPWERGEPNRYFDEGR